MTISPEELQAVASLSYLDISDEQTNKLNEEMNSIMDFVEQLQKMNTDGLAPLFHPLAMAARFREDLITEADCSAQLEAIAHSFDDGLYLVPQVVDSGS